LGTLFSALNIGRAGLQVAQVQLDVTGHNIANVNKVGFSRQRAIMTTRIPNMKPYGALGRGPAIDNIERIREEFLDIVFRRQVPQLGEAEVIERYFSRIEDIFQEPSENGFSRRLGVFFDALQDFANNVEGLPSRVALLSEAEAVATSLNEVAQRLELLRTNANEEVRNLIPEINSLAERIAESNLIIKEAELNGRTANDLRDDRDVLIDELARLVTISTRERDDGQIDIQLGGDELVTGRSFRELETVIDGSIDPDRPDLLRVQFVDNGEAAQLLEGELAGVLRVRDVTVSDLEDRIDEMAAALIESINGIHSQGNGLENIGIALTGFNGVASPAAALNSAGLPFTVSDGSFNIVVYDAAGSVIETVSISILASGPPETTLENIADAINASANMTASIGASGRLTVTPGAGMTYTFASDSSNVLAALGLNGLFTGDDAASIAVSRHLLDDPNLLSSGFSLDVLATGDNSAALAMAGIQTTDILTNGTQTMEEFYESIIVEIGVDSRANLQTLDVERAFVRDFEARRQEVSGVNLDEEVTNLIMFQRAFESAARVITVTDSMLETLVNLVR